MRIVLWILATMVAISGCTDDPAPPGPDGDTGTGPGTDPGTDGGSGMDPGTDDTEPDGMAFEPVYINGTLSQNLADCSDPSAMIADGASHSLPDGAAGRSYSVSVVAAGEIPTEAVCVSFDTGSASGMSGTVPDDATTIIIGGDFAVGTAYSILIS